jgi:hypothetical protein
MTPGVISPPHGRKTQGKDGFAQLGHSPILMSVSGPCRHEIRKARIFRLLSADSVLYYWEARGRTKTEQ